MTDDTLLTTPVQYIKGVGPQRALSLARLKIKTLKDLLYFFPRRYEDRRSIKPISKIAVGQTETISGKILAAGITQSQKGKEFFQIAINDSSGAMIATWFNQLYLEKILEKGQQIILHGKVQWFNRVQMVNPEFEIISDTDDACIHTGRITPVYPLTEKLNQKTIRTILFKAVQQNCEKIQELIPQTLLDEMDLPVLNDALLNMHFPESIHTQEKALKRFKFEELLLMELAVTLKKQQIKKASKNRTYPELNKNIKAFLASLDFTFTEAQKRSLLEINSDLASDNPMNRLLQGDVGAGKTVVAIAAAFGVMCSGYQVVFMAPTEILARQHYQTIKKLLAASSITCAFLISDMSAREKKKSLSDIASGKVSLIVGTHALISEAVTYEKLGMIIIDEQHRFGVVQRSSLIRKTHTPDILVMSATPIPRTLAMTVYGDLDVSVIDQLPPGRGEVITTHITQERVENVYKFIRQEIDKGNQAFIIYPLIEESDAMELKAATTMYETLQKSFFKNHELGLIHGKMTAEEKADRIAQFQQKKIHVLVATTIIEVGIDIPNATIMLIENAERFGLAQLHQLRGRIGRGHKKSYCVLEGTPRTEEGMQRIQAMVETDDGFKIAEKDLAIRGPGEFFGTRQYGMPELRIANILTDMPLLLRARHIAQKLVEKNPSLEGTQYAPLKAALLEKFKGKFKFFNV